MQITKLGGFLDEPKAGAMGSRLPETRDDRVCTTMIPAPLAKTIKNKKVNSPTRLLAATLAFKILNKFADGITQSRMQERYNIRPKQLALYLTGRRYLGGRTEKEEFRKVTRKPRHVR